MSINLKNSRQKAHVNSGTIYKLFNALVLNLFHNPKGYREFWHIATKKSSGISISIPFNFPLLSAKIDLVANIKNILEIVSPTIMKYIKI
jgi:hypothetical protein